MRLIEVVMLMGAHCVSPVEHSTLSTDAAKVQCAVVMERDTERGTLTVTPPAAAADPQVAAAIERFRLAPVGGTKIVPAWAPAGSPSSEVKLPEPVLPSASLAKEPQPVPPHITEARPAPPTASSEPAAEQKLATLSPPPPKRSPARATASPAKPKSAKKQAVAAPKAAGQCRGNAVARWYTTADGRKKYRCVKQASDSAPNLLY